ncbi:MAG: hypothetical protein IZT59_03055 [Verrucomicrobia bacterium]|jgi:hypothetical protein|nr:hypothetical protein [Verrucomicrobiota bacterium]|tara:strand:- start:756 stop:1430 length:675 start_codon:yes stop_codon:yes gene_type:complete
MSKIPSITEQELQGLNPCGLDEEFLSRLAASAEETFTELSSQELEFENKLRDIRPRKIQSALVADLQGKIGDTPFSVDKKIVLFNKSSKGNHAASKNRKASNIFRFNIAAAAAVAILGSVAALMLPNNTPAETSTAAATTETENIAPTAFVPNQLPQTNFVPTSYDRNLSNTRDQSVIWKDNNQPYRVLLHTFTDRISKDNENGETIQVEQPSFEYSLIPEKVD